MIRYLLLLMFLYQVTWAQRVKTDPIEFNPKYINLPTFNLEDSLNTYSVDMVDNGELGEIGLSKGQFLPQINLQGFKKFEKGGHFTIKTEINSGVVLNKEIKDESVQHKDTTGKVIKTDYKFYYKASIYYPIKYSLVTYDGEVLHDIVVADSRTLINYKSDVYDNKTKVEYNIAALEKKWKADFVRAKMTSLNQNLNQNFGFEKITGKDYFILPKSKKVKALDGYVDRLLNMKTYFDQTNFEEKPDSNKIKDELSFLRETIKKLEGDDDKQIKIAILSTNINLMRAYIYVEDLDKAAIFAKKIIAEDFKSRNYKSSLSSINRLKNQFERSIYGSRHFRRDVSQAKNPMEAIWAAEKAVSLEEAKAKELEAKKAIENAAIEFENSMKDIDKQIAGSNSKENIGELNFLKYKKYAEKKLEELGKVNLDRAIENAPTRKDYIYERGRYYHYRKDYEKASNDFLGAYKLDTLNHEALYWSAESKKLNNDFQGAKPLFFKVFQETKDLKYGNKYLETLIQLKEYPAVINTANDLLKINPEAIELNLKIAEINILTNKCVDAKQYIDKYLNSSKLSKEEKRDGIVMDGRYLHCMGEYEDAIDRFDDALKLKVKKSTYQMLIGRDGANLDKWMESFERGKISDLKRISEIEHNKEEK